jgi:single-stranded-DNA-specific exonuclease
LGLAALGTVADVVDLRDENRALTAYGLKALRTTEMAGLRALMETSGTNGGKPLSSWDIAFKLAPRLNAAGRVGDPYRALDLLLSEDEGQAMTLAEELERANRERQSIQARVLEDARSMAELLADSGGGMPPAVVLWSDRWHVGVVGIAAGNLARDLHRPVVLIATEGARGRGSARSIEGFELHRALAECSGLLIRYGGHAMAAGVTLEVGRLKEFRERLVSIAARELPPERLRPTLRIDAVCPLGAVGEALCSELDALGPFGCGNPEPVVATGNLRLAGEVRLMSSGKHVSFYASDGKRSFRAVGFGMGPRVRDLDRLAGREIELAHRPGINDFRGVKSVELYVEDVRAAGA